MHIKHSKHTKKMKIKKKNFDKNDLLHAVLNFY